MTIKYLYVGQASGQGLQPTPDQGSIKGTVVNSVTRAPIPRAVVFTPDNRFATLTDGEGHFEFPIPKTNGTNDSGMFFGGPVRQIRSVVGGGSISFLLARKPGFLDDPNERGPLDASSGTEIIIPLMPEALIKGRVIRSDGDPASGIIVKLLSRVVQEGMRKWVQGPTARANSNGEFRFAELQPGTYKVATNEFLDNDPATTVPGGQQYGFPPVYYPGVPDSDAAGVVQLTAGQSAQVEIPLVRQPYYPVRIPIANAELNGGLNIMVLRQGPSASPDYGLGYNSQRQSIEGMLPNGNYLVEAMGHGQNSVAGSVRLTVASSPAEGPSLTLSPNSSISVHVADQFTSGDSNYPASQDWNIRGKTFHVHGPHTYLQINAEPADDFRRGGGSLRPPMGSNDDSLVLENLAPGRYWLRVRSSRGYVAAATLGGVDLLRQPFVVAPGSSNPIEVTVRDDTAELEGTVSGMATPAIADATSTSSQPQAWVYCIPLPDSSGQFQQVWVAPDGKFTAAAMAPGTYRVLAFKNQQPNLPYRDAEAMRAYESKGQVVHLPAGQKVSIQVQIISNIE